MAVLPGGGKSMPEFNKDDIACRDSATASAKDLTPPPMAMGFVKGEVVASRGNRLVLREEKESASFTTQQRYDTAYVQCMYSKGHKIPVNEAMRS